MAILSTTDKQFRDTSLGLCFWNVDTYDCVMSLVKGMLYERTGKTLDQLDDYEVAVTVEYAGKEVL